MRRAQCSRTTWRCRAAWWSIRHYLKMSCAMSLAAPASAENLRRAARCAGRAGLLAGRQLCAEELREARPPLRGVGVGHGLDLELVVARAVFGTLAGWGTA